MGKRKEEEEEGREWKCEKRMVVWKDVYENFQKISETLQKKILQKLCKNSFKEQPNQSIMLHIESLVIQFQSS